MLTEIFGSEAPESDIAERDGLSDSSDIKGPGDEIYGPEEGSINIEATLI